MSNTTTCPPPCNEKTAPASNGATIADILVTLNRALAEEWISFFQYWMDAQVCRGPMRESVTRELQEHSRDEFKHANMLMKRIIELGGKPNADAKTLFSSAQCTYHAPTDTGSMPIIQQSIDSEQCAIRTMYQLMSQCERIDPATYKMAVDILQEEISHLSDMRQCAEDIQALAAMARVN